MNQKMNWQEMVKNYPDEWVALADYKENGAIEIKGTVIAHNPNKRELYFVHRRPNFPVFAPHFR